jgi:hypothetical protein
MNGREIALPHPFDEALNHGFAPEIERRVLSFEPLQAAVGTGDLAQADQARLQIGDLGL